MRPQKVIKRGSNNHADDRRFYRETASACGAVGTDAGALSAIALALLAIEVQMARFNDIAEQMLKMVKEDMV